jgi:hypothetical protein
MRYFWRDMTFLCQWAVAISWMTLIVCTPLMGLQAQNSRLCLSANRIQSPICLDGVLNDVAWGSSRDTSRFFQYEPEPGVLSRVSSSIRVLYDNDALYVGAWLFDSAPDSILRELCVRDEFGNVDVFGIEINPYDDGQNSFVFRVYC